MPRTPRRWCCALLSGGPMSELRRWAAVGPGGSSRLCAWRRRKGGKPIADDLCVPGHVKRVGDRSVGVAEHLQPTLALAMTSLCPNADLSSTFATGAEGSMTFGYGRA